MGRSSSPGKGKIFSTPSRPILGFTSLLSIGCWSRLSPGVKRRGREADHSPPLLIRSEVRGQLYSYCTEVSLLGLRFLHRSDYEEGSCGRRLQTFRREALLPAGPKGFPDKKPLTSNVSVRATCIKRSG
jgi:hypothetical protein